MRSSEVNEHVSRRQEIFHQTRISNCLHSISEDVQTMLLGLDTVYYWGEIKKKYENRNDVGQYKLSGFIAHMLRDS